MSLEFALFLALALLFDFLCGVNDSGNLAAMLISSRALPPRLALLLTALAAFAGPFLLGLAVATTLGGEVVRAAHTTLTMLSVALLAAILWNRWTVAWGVPSSASHALVGGLLGAVWVGAGREAILLPGVGKVLLALFLSPLLGLVVGFLFTRLVFFFAQAATPAINTFFKRAQVLVAVTFALGYGANDAQKTMGIITLGLVVGGWLPTFEVPRWVIVVSAGAIALGVFSGGWRVIHTLGQRFYRIKPLDGFCAQTASAGVVLGASVLGGPVSSTQVVSAAILGVGAAERPNKVRWGLAGEIGLAWGVTLPATALLSAGLYLLASAIGGGR